jgi:hypothetical protein
MDASQYSTVETLRDGLKVFEKCGPSMKTKREPDALHVLLSLA